LAWGVFTGRVYCGEVVIETWEHLANANTDVMDGGGGEVGVAGQYNEHCAVECNAM
jgi:hypothetical protein